MTQPPEPDSPTIALIDHGAGNMVSMERALVVSGAQVAIVTDGSVGLDRYDGVVLPGVGATGPAMATLHERGLVAPISTYQGPLLAVCVGMQVLFEYSLEDATRCLALIPGTVRRLTGTPLPHMGWNDVTHGPDAVLGSGGPTPFYFVHSFALTEVDNSCVVGTTTYGDQTFASAVRRDNIFGVQFHPERSAEAGLAVIGSFVATTVGARRVA